MLLLHPMYSKESGGPRQRYGPGRELPLGRQVDPVCGDLLGPRNPKGRELAAGPRECALLSYDRRAGSPVPRSGLVQLPIYRFTRQPEQLPESKSYTQAFPQVLISCLVL